MTRPVHRFRMFFLALFALTLGSCVRPPASAFVTEQEQERIAGDLAAYIAFAHAPAHVAPPTVSWAEREVSSGAIVARVTAIQPERAGWNRWPDGSARLFNDRTAFLFLVRIEGDGPLAWRPAETTLELNDPDHRIPAAGSADEVLRDLTFWATMQERWLLDGDLAARARGGGAFRASYLPREVAEGPLEGLIVFPTAQATGPVQGAELAELHVVAVRLTLAVDTPSGPAELVWVFD